jgi:predicted nucleotidyltransferase
MRTLPAIRRKLENAAWLSSIERDAVLRFKQRVSALPGIRVQQFVLFGSRARGEGHEASDLDLAVVLLEDEGPHWRQIVDVATELNLDYEYRIRVSPLILSRAKLLNLWERERTIAEAIIIEGIEV